MKLIQPAAWLCEGFVTNSLYTPMGARIVPIVPSQDLGGKPGRPLRARNVEAELLGGQLAGANAGNSAACYLLSTASTAAVGDMCASASGNSATSCVRTATINTACDRSATISTASIGAAATAILVVRITISSAIITAATGYNGSPSNDRSATIGGTASNCATSGAGALAPDQDNLSVIGRNNFEGILWKDRNRRTHCRQDKQGGASKPRKSQLEP